ncbi:hypothetical protein SADUNF_Sadunf06G0195100 [Salix dunnii]|uniref:Uncharacterized protein n=1 Tax=Salix dunnii TaxID=1413687 RepID=A0A835K886_9ROSI|nr:hypothetical protein SADUNF_Sadunf06G0195100 [Salix dunnii]
MFPHFLITIVLLQAHGANAIEVYKEKTLEGRAGQVERFTIQSASCPCSGDERAVLEWLLWSEVQEVGFVAACKDTNKSCYDI